jgi:hypothetical protein
VKLPEIRAKLFEHCFNADAHLVLHKTEGLMLINGPQEETVYASFVKSLTGADPSIDFYTEAARILGQENELDLYYALTRPEQGSENARRQRWLRRLIFRDLGIRA